jgi:Ca-activated chloride channel family protein
MLELWGNRAALRWLTAADAILYLYILYWFWKAQRADEALRVSVGSPPRVRLFAIVSTALGVVSVGAYLALVLYLDAAISSVPLALSLSLVALGVFNAGLTPILSFTLRVQRSRQRARSAGPSVAPSPLLRALSDHSGRKQVLQFVLVFIALLLLIIAAMRPQTSGKQHKVKHNGVDIVFAVDLSKSMLAEDLKPSRLQAARNEVHALLDQLKGERVGLVVFTATAFSQCPLTSDYGVLHNYIDSIEPHLMPRGGTAIGRAIDEARYLLSGQNPRRERMLAEGSGRASAPKPPAPAGTQNNKLLILFSDGEDHETDPQRAALAARQDNIRIFTVGLGTPSGSSIPKFKDDLRVGVETHHGAPIHTRMDEALLRDVASSTGGLYISYAGPNSVVQPVLEQIARMDSMQHESDQTRYRDDHFFLLLWPAALLLALSGLLGDRKGFSWRGLGLARGGEAASAKPSPARAKRRRKPGASSAAVVILFACVAAASLSQQGCAAEDKPQADKPLFERPNAHVEAANQHLSDRKVNAALDAYRQAAIDLPKHPILDYNFGVATFYLSDVTDPNVESPEDALQRALVYLERALRAPLSDTDTHFRIHYNIGNTYLKLARRLILNPPAQNPNDPLPALDPLLKAADSYAQALSFTPDSDDARYNLELALALTTPPCSQFEDEFEPNNDPASASANPPDLIALAKSKKPTHTLCGGDDDLFPLPPDAAPGDRIHVSATFSRLPQRKKQPPLDDSALLEFAQIEVAVIDAKGNTLSGVLLSPPAASAVDPANPVNPAPPVDPLAPVLAQDLGPEQPPAKPIQKLTREIPPLTLAATLPSGEAPALPLFVRVRGLDNAEALYSIRIDHRPPCQKLDDPLESNNTLADAKRLTPDLAMPRGGPIPLPPTGDHYQLRACPADEDWFSLRTSPGDALFIDLNPAKDPLTDLPPKLTLELFADDDPTPIRSAGLDANGLTLQDGLLNMELFDLDPLMAEGHLLRLRVSAVDAQQEGNYTLTIYHYPPCPSGDDPLAPNHAAISRSTLDPKQKFIRYLRVCPATPDFFLAQAKGPEEPPAPTPAPNAPPAPTPAPPPGAGPDTTNQLPEPPVVGFNAHIEYDPRFGDLSLTARDPDDQSILPKGEGAVGKSQTPKKQIKTITLEGALEGQEFQLDVKGDPSFYSLYLLNNDEQDKAENQGGSGNSGTPQDPSEPQEPQGDNPQPQDPQDDPQGQGDQPPPDEPPPDGQGNPGDPDGERRQQELTEDFLEDLERRDRGLHRLDPDVDDSSPLNDW